MMSPEQNELITRTGPATRCGALMRHYWHPVALAEALEVGIDPAHASYLHRFYEDEDPSGDAYGRQFRASSSDSDIPMTRMMRQYTRPQIDVEATDYGMRLYTLRKINDRNTHVRVTN